MSEHTPGPWKWGPKINALCGDGMWFAKIAWTVREPRNEADARLIVAAPDMLAALIQARGALRLDAMVDDAGKPFGTTTVALEYIDAAIAKARAS